MKVHSIGRLAACLLAVAVLASPTEVFAASVTNLRCEYRIDPLGIDVRQPRLSWVIESACRGERQTAYQVLVSMLERLAKDQGDLWDSGKVSSDRSTHVEYAGEPPASRMRAPLEGARWDQEGKATKWSEEAKWTMGLVVSPGVAGQVELASLTRRLPKRRDLASCESSTANINPFPAKRPEM